MWHENVEIVRDQYAATNEGDFSRAMAHYDADVVLIVPPGFIDPGTYQGRDAVGAWFGDWFKKLRAERRDFATASTSAARRRA